MSTLTELKQKLEAARVERERREQETREQEEQELLRMAEEERRQEEEERARREQQRADKERKRAEEEAEVQRKAGKERVAGEEGQKTMETEGGEGSREAGMAAEVAELTDETWEEDVARLHAAAMAGGEEEYQATEDMCWNCWHWKLVCERPE